MSLNTMQNVCETWPSKLGPYLTVAGAPSSSTKVEEEVQRVALGCGQLELPL